ncbi:hypothetical protein [Campylobacter sp.]|uniref:hypothetical protein n=1 Tax=Campylobacter sp. TaxID=205 RepID=UPI002A52D424|nr:hypothetical protein [Campylobacter sp.]MDD7091668.1 hypothetical protein [Campylobacteraceae bacterium]MDY3668662.1 hypothetical protein [Campylobacter sp.]MDY5285321.1 hypothetical protein [Campylobacter sp.]
MKKLLFSSVLVASLASSLFATDGADLLASVTNGKISDNSPGVKVLSLDEAKQVKGGYEIQVFDNIDIINIGGGATIKQAHAMIKLSKIETKNKTLCTYGAKSCSASSPYNKLRYNKYNRLANQEKGEVVIITSAMVTTPQLYPMGLKTTKTSFKTTAGVYKLVNGSYSKIKNIPMTNTTILDAKKIISNTLNQKLITK